MADRKTSSFERAHLGRTGLEVGRLHIAPGYGVLSGALESVRLGPMTNDELACMRRVGRAVAGK